MTEDFKDFEPLVDIELVKAQQHTIKVAMYIKALRQTAKSAEERTFALKIRQKFLDSLDSARKSVTEIFQNEQ